MSARDEVLGRVRSALGDARGREVEVPRGYRSASEAPHEQVVERFAERVADYRATVRRASKGELAGVLAGACRERGAARLGVAAGLPGEGRAGGGGVVGGEETSPADPRRAGGGATRCRPATA